MNPQTNRSSQEPEERKEKIQKCWYEVYAHEQKARTKEEKEFVLNLSILLTQAESNQEIDQDILSNVKAAFSSSSTLSDYYIQCMGLLESYYIKNK